MYVADVVSLNRMPSGRYAFSLKQMRERANNKGHYEIVARIDSAIEEAKSTMTTEMLWDETQGSRTSARGDAALIDNDIDALIGSIRDRVETDIVGEDDDPIRLKAEDFMRIVFPHGVSAIIHRPFEVQLGMMDTMMARVEDDLSDHVDVLGLTRHMDRLATLIERFRTELEENPVDELSYDEVRAAREDLHEATCRVVVAVMFVLDGNDEATVNERSHILRPLQQQQELVAEARRRQRHPTDVDPETGAEVLEDDAYPGDDSEPDVDSQSDTAPEADVEPAGA